MPLSNPAVLSAFLHLIITAGLALFFSLGIPVCFFCIYSLRADKLQWSLESDRYKEWLQAKYHGDEITIIRTDG